MSGMVYRVLSILSVLVCVAAAPGAEPVGVFEDHGDVGQPAKNGSTEYDAQKHVYRVTGGGENMWAKTDAFQFVWKRMSGDVSLTADIRWPKAGGNAHRKACLLIRQSLDADSAYVDVAVHGDGLTSMQYREAAGEMTKEIQSKVSAPLRVRLEKRGEEFFISVAREGEELKRAEGSVKLKLKEPFYVGLGVCAHDNAVVETAEFGEVQLGDGKRQQ